MAQMVVVNGVLSAKSVVVKDRRTGIGEAKTVWELQTPAGAMTCWDDPAAWNPTGVWPMTVTGTVTNKPYQGQTQFTLKGPRPVPTREAVGPLTPAPTAPASSSAPSQPSAVKTAFDRLADKDRVVARESVLKSVAEMLDKIAKPLDKEGLSRGWQAGDIIALCRTLEELYIYRPEDAP